MHSYLSCEICGKGCNVLDSSAWLCLPAAAAGARSCVATKGGSWLWSALMALDGPMRGRLGRLLWVWKDSIDR